MSITETEKKYLEDENTSIDNAMLYKELKALREELVAIQNNTSDKMTQEKILSIKDPHERHRAIRDNMELFKADSIGGRQHE